MNTQTSNSDGTSDGMVNLQPSTNDHTSGDGSTPNPQPSSSHHSSENDSTALPGCSNTNSVTFSTTLSLGSASVTSTSTITGQGIAYSEIFCSIKGPTTTLEAKNKLSTNGSADVDSSPLSSRDGASASGDSEPSTSLGNESPSTDLDSVSKSAHSMPGDSGSSSVNTEFDLDKLERTHFKYRHTGPATVVLRSSKFYSSSMQNHATDIKPLLHAVQSQGKTVVVIIADGGPDWNTGSLVSALFLMRLWRDCNLDMLICTSFVAQLSAYNPIEHAFMVSTW